MKQYKNQYKTTDTFTCKDGKCISYEDVFKGIDNNVRAYAARNGKNYEAGDMNDVFQDAAVKAIVSHGSYDSTKRANPTTYGSRITDNCEKDAFTREMTHNVRYTSLDDNAEDNGAADRYVFIRHRGDEYEADRLLRTEEANAYIEQTIESLNGDYKMLIRMKIRGMDTEEIAQTLNWDVDTVYRKSCRARKALAKALGKDFLGEYGYGN